VREIELALDIQKNLDKVNYLECEEQRNLRTDDGN
jgi:hypothetical protein